MVIFPREISVRFMNDIVVKLYFPEKFKLD